jgi:uncharacterized protein
MRSPPRLDEVLLVTVIFSGWFIYTSLEAVLQGFPTGQFSDADGLQLVAYELLMFPAALAVLVSRGWRWKDFAFRVTWSGCLLGLVLLFLTYIAHILVWVLLSPTIGGREVLEAFGGMIAVSIPVALAVSIVNGAFEEFFLTRYLVEALASYGAIIAIGFSALIRVLFHLYQGPTGAVSVLAFALVLTIFYWRTREIWPVTFAHMAADFIAFM